MKQFALIVDGLVAEVIPEFITVGEGEEAVTVPLSDRYTSEFIAQLVPYDPANPPAAPEPEPMPIPTSVTMRQARLALLAAGKLGAVNDAITGLPSPQKEAAQIEWDFAATVDRASPFLATLAGMLQLDSDALDQLFMEAASL